MSPRLSGRYSLPAWTRRRRPIRTARIAKTSTGCGGSISLSRTFVDPYGLTFDDGDRSQRREHFAFKKFDRHHRISSKADRERLIGVRLSARSRNNAHEKLGSANGTEPDFGQTTSPDHSAGYSLAG
jgi:hypothetical protein